MQSFSVAMKRTIPGWWWSRRGTEEDEEAAKMGAGPGGRCAGRGSGGAGRDVDMDDVEAAGGCSAASLL